MPRAPARRDASTSPDVARLVMLHHRRRGWAWVATGSVTGLAVYAGIDVSLLANLTGAAGALSIIPVVALLALALAGLAIVIVDTSLIHRAGSAARARAKGSVSHYPLYAHAHSYPPRHHASWAAAIFMLAAMTGITLFILPAEVNSLAYVAGAETHDTFNPVSYSQACTSAGRRGGSCHTVTDGYLSRSGTDVTWNSQVPLSQPFSVRDPAWAWGSGRNLTSGETSAVLTILASLFFNGVTLLLVYAIVVFWRGTSSGRGRHMPAPAGAVPGGVTRAQHPGRTHQGGGTGSGARSGARSRARRRRGRR
jgi:hypothetical protein